MAAPSKKQVSAPGLDPHCLHRAREASTLTLLKRKGLSTPDKSTWRWACALHPQNSRGHMETQNSPWTFAASKKELRPFLSLCSLHQILESWNSKYIILNSIIYSEHWDLNLVGFTAHQILKCKTVQISNICVQYSAMVWLHDSFWQFYCVCVVVLRIGGFLFFISVSRIT